MADRLFNADVIVGDRTEALLRTQNLLSCQWRIPPVERQRIRDNNIKLGVVFPPASCLSLIISGAATGQRINVVTIELDAVGFYGFSQAESVATILHEIGHIVNPYPPTGAANHGDTGGGQSPTLLREMYADDYARLCGFGNEIASSLKKCSDKNPTEFKPEQVNERIRRIVENVRNSMTP